MSTGLGENAAFTQWNHPSVDDYKEQITNQNDGTQPLEPYQRVSQQLFETWMRGLGEGNPLIDLLYEHKLDSIHETEKGVEAAVITKDGSSHKIQAAYAVACDGASSKSRRSLGIDLEGGPL